MIKLKENMINNEKSRIHIGQLWYSGKIYEKNTFNYDFKKIDFSKSFLEYYSTDFEEVLISKRIKKINGMKKVWRR